MQPQMPLGQPIQLFNGVDFAGWRHAGKGRFSIQDGMLITDGGLGLLWYSALQFRDFTLTVDWKATKKSDNSGVFVRFPAPDGDPRIAIKHGYEIQIDDEGAPDGAMIHKTGAVYGLHPPTKIASKPPGDWNTFLIRIEGNLYHVTLNGEPVISDFTGTRSSKGYIGLQNHSPDDRVYFRDVVATPLR